MAPETGLRLDEHTYLEPDLVIVGAEKDVTRLQGQDVLLAVEVADSSLDYDLHRKPFVYARFGVRELWVIDAKRRVVHIAVRPGAEGYGTMTTRGASERLQPTELPADFGFTLNDLKRR